MNRVTRFMAGSCVLAAMALLISCGDRSKLTFDLPTISVKGHVLKVEVRYSDLGRQEGLKRRESLPEEQGMLFVFGPPAEKDVGFWMDQTLIPLSIAYIDEKGVIFQIEDMAPMTQETHKAVQPVRYALEVNQGWFVRHGVGVGDMVDVSGVPADQLIGEPR